MSKILITSKVLVFSNDGKTYTIMKTHENFESILYALQSGNTKKAYENMQHKTDRKLKIKGNDLYFEEEKFDSIFAEAYAVAKENGLSVDKLELFFKNLKKNPSPISVHAFSSFLAKSRMPITDRGTFLAYKKVRHDFTDIYSGNFDNRPGMVCQMDRGSVDAIQSNTCSTGFHICSYEYLDHFGSHTSYDNKVIVVEIHPRDVVAVPPDYSNTKMRVASYRVLCTLDYFKKRLLSYEADALGRIPIFNSKSFTSWSPLSDVENKYLIDESIKGNPFMTAKDWLKSREVAK